MPFECKVELKMGKGLGSSRFFYRGSIIYKLGDLVRSDLVLRTGPPLRLVDKYEAMLSAAI